MKKFIGFIAVVCLLASFAAVADSGARIAIVDLQKALNESSLGQKIKADLKKKYDAHKNEIDKEKDALQKEAEELKKQSGVLSQEAMQDKMRSFQDRYVALQNKAADYEREIRTAEMESTNQHITSLKSYVQELAAGKYDLVLENSAQIVLYGPQATDITGDLITMFNKKGLKK